MQVDQVEELRTTLKTEKDLNRANGNMVRLPVIKHSWLTTYTSNEICEILVDLSNDIKTLQNCRLSKNFVCVQHKKREMELSTKVKRLEKEVKDGRETTARIRIALSDVSTTIVFVVLSRDCDFLF